MQKTILFTLLLILLFTSTNSQFEAKIASYQQCCDIQWIYSLDKTWWMRPLYDWLASPTPYPDPDTLIGQTAISLNAWRQYFDYYMSVHQYDCNSYPIMNHRTPIHYPGVQYPVLENEWCGLISDLNHPLNYLADQLLIHRDHTYFTVYVAATPLTGYPDPATVTRVIDAIKSNGCYITITVYVVQWWRFWPYKRNLQEVQIPSPVAVEEDISTPEEVVALQSVQNKARTLYDELSLATNPDAANQLPSFILFRNFNANPVRNALAEFRLAGAATQMVTITSREQFEQVLKDDIKKKSETGQ